MTKIKYLIVADDENEVLYIINIRNIYKLNNDCLVLGRNNFDIKKFTNDSVNYMTIHSSKGLEANNVIIINLTNNKYGLPNQIKNNQLIEQLHPTTKEMLNFTYIQTNIYQI